MIKDKLDYLLNSVAVIFTALQTDQILQIISIALTILSILFSLSFTIYKWYKESMKDGRISEEELKDLKDKIEDATKDIKKGQNNND